MKTIEQIGEAIHPTPEMEAPVDESVEDEVEVGEEESDIYQNRHNLRPSEVKKYRRQDRRDDRKQGRQTVAFEDETGQGERVQDSRERLGISLDDMGDDDK